mgnify:CR=1 FL=1
MDLVRNLKKKLNLWVDKTLAELSYLYIIQKAKQTSKKPDNSLPTEFLQNNLTMEHQRTTIAISSHDISEKTTSEEIEPVAQIRNWALKRLEEAKTVGEKDAIYKEFEDWIELEDKEEVEYICLEDAGWGEQEIDVK